MTLASKVLIAIIVAAVVSIGRGDPSPVVFGRSQLLPYQTVELRFYNIITTTNTIFLESVLAIRHSFMFPGYCIIFAPWRHTRPI